MAEKKVVKRGPKPKPAVPKEESKSEWIEVTKEELAQLQKDGKLVGWDGKKALVKKEVK